MRKNSFVAEVTFKHKKSIKTMQSEKIVNQNSLTFLLKVRKMC